MADIRHSVIELLSVELWQEIFEYLKLNDLWYSFSGLNSRIDAIIDQTILHVNFKNEDDYDYFKKNILSSMNIANIRSLKLRRINEIKHFFSIYSLSSFTQLRLLSLTLRYSFNDKFGFWDQLSSLKNLRLLEVKFWNIAGPNGCIQEKEYIIRLIFNKGYCPLLESLIIDTCGMQKMIPKKLPFLMRTDRTTNIKRLFVDSFTFNDLMKLRPAIQNVQSLCPDYQLDYSTTSPMLLKCIQLKVQLSRYFMFEYVEYLLQQTPNLEELILSGWYHLLNAKKWELLLSTQCTKLIKFELICLGNDCDDSFEKAVDNFEREYNITLFWLKRNTIVKKDRSRCSFCCRFDIVA